MKYIIYIIALPATWIISGRLWAEPLTPSALLKEVYEKNSLIKSEEAKKDAEAALVSAKGTLANPRIGVMRENSPTGGGGEKMGPMYSFSLSQEIMWPSRYGLMRSMQQIKTAAASEEYLNAKLDTRKKALITYYNLYASSRILGLLETQRETLHQIARIAEVRRAAGQATQQDEMKAHVEETKIEMELILQKQEIASMTAELNAFMSRNQESAIQLPDRDLVVPQITVPLNKVVELSRENSKMIKSQKAMAAESQAALDLAKTAYYPEFMIGYSKPFSGEYYPQNYTIELTMSVPVWFSSKESAQIAATSLQKASAEYRLEQVQRDTEKETRVFTNQLQALSKLLKVYDTAKSRL